MNQDFYDLFVDQLEDMYSSEHQIIKALPKVIDRVSSSDLKQALSTHLKDTILQVERIEKIFLILELTPNEKKCLSMEGLLKETDEIMKDKIKSSVLDAAIICACQKVEHYEIASYGTLREFAKHLSLDTEIINMLQDSLNEEGNLNKLLTKIAQGSFFSNGVNHEAVAIKNNNNIKNNNL